MRRLLTLAAFLLIFSLGPVYAQRGGGHGGGGGHGAISGHSGFSGHISGPVGGGSHYSSFSGSHNGAGLRYYPNHSSGVRIRTYGYGYGRRCYGCWVYGYPYYGYYDPYWWWDSGSSYDQDQASQRELADEMNEQNIEEQQLRQQDQDVYARHQPHDAQPNKEERAENNPATVLVFRDQHQREIQNYAIADGLLWNFTGTHTEKIPLAVLDIPATRKANDDRGVDFHLPDAGEGQ